jgi:hypothetical protein
MLGFVLGVDHCDGLRVGASVGHGQEELLVVLELEVLIGELIAVDGATTSTLFRRKSGIISNFSRREILTLPRVKSPPWSMKPGITRWKVEPL